jgi:precorrin-6A/cobalt-precorrin-6A reductase
MRLLILGGTADASALAKRLLGDARFEPTLSLAGRTVSPATPAIPFRIGGFGGADGLAAYLRDERIDAMIDATHPFAARISANAVKAAEAASVPLASLVRPAWARHEGDRWICVATPEAAAAALGDELHNVFLTVGRLELPAFAAAPQHRYVARVIDRPEGMALPPDLAFIEARGPYDAEAELKLMREGGFDIVVSKNSGGAATYGKIVAARALGLPVVMIERPEKPAGHALGSPAEAVAWLETLLAARDHSGARSERGV